MNGLTLMMNTRASVTRPSESGGKVDTPVTVHASAMFTPFDPITTEMLQRFALDTPVNLFQTFTRCADVKPGDTVTRLSDSATFSVSGVDDWAEHGSRSSRVMGSYKVLALTQVQVKL